MKCQPEYFAKRVNFIVFAVILLALFAHKSFGKVSLDFRPSTEVKSSHVLLGEIADIRGVSKEQLEKIRSIKIRKAPEPGYTIRIQFSLIRTRLRFAGLKPDELNIKAPRSISVTTTSIKVSGKELAKTAQNYLMRHFAQTGWKIEAKACRTPSNLTLRAGKLELKPRISPDVKFSRRVPVEIDVYVDGERAKTVNVNVELSTTAKVVVAKNNIAAFKAIEKTQVKLAKKKIKGPVNNILTNIDSASGMRCKRLIRAGAILTKDMLEPIPTISRGDVIPIFVEFGSVIVKARGKALEDGRVGDNIKVVNVNSNKRLTGIVTDKKSVRIILTTAR